MADQQIGNSLGVTAVGYQPSTKKAAVTADGGAADNICTVDSQENLGAGQTYEFVDPANGSTVISARTVTQVNSDGNITFDGAIDILAVGTELHLASEFADASGELNLNGGRSAQSGFEDDNFDSIASMRTRLKAIDAGLYTDAYLNMMTYNDLVYAIRVADHPGTI